MSSASSRARASGHGRSARPWRHLLDPCRPVSVFDVVEMLRHLGGHDRADAPAVPRQIDDAPITDAGVEQLRKLRTCVGDAQLDVAPEAGEDMA